MLLEYVIHFTTRYEEHILNILDLIDLSLYPKFKIFSAGCGAAPDLMAFETIKGDKELFYKGIDKNKRWYNIHSLIEIYSRSVTNMQVKLKQKDVFSELNNEEVSFTDYNVIVLQYFLSHLTNTGQEKRMLDFFDLLIKKFVKHRFEESPFLIIITDIDNIEKGFKNWFRLLDKLEEAGFCGKCIAKSTQPNSSLGKERWSYNKKKASFQNIKYTYIQNESIHDGAKLIIELDMLKKEKGGAKQNDN